MDQMSTSSTSSFYISVGSFMLVIHHLGSIFGFKYIMISTGKTRYCDTDPTTFPLLQRSWLFLYDSDNPHPSYLSCRQSSEGNPDSIKIRYHG